MQNWLIHIVGQQKEIRDEESVCIRLVPINQESIDNVVGENVLIIVVSKRTDILISRHFQFPPDELMSSDASERDVTRGAKNVPERAGWRSETWRRLGIKLPAVTTLPLKCCTVIP